MYKQTQAAAVVVMAFGAVNGVVPEIAMCYRDTAVVLVL